jgi:hypothetical protein
LGQGYLQVKNKIQSTYVILVRFRNGCNPKFNAASDEKQNIKKRLIKFWKPELKYHKFKQCAHQFLLFLGIKTTTTSSE